MKSFLTNITSDKITYRGFLLSLFISLLTGLFVVFNYKNLPPLIPIFNQLPWGMERLTPTQGIFIPIAVFLFVFLLNAIIASVVYSKNPLIARILSATTLLVSIINFLFIIRTVLVIL